MSEVPVQPVADKPAMSFFQRLVGIYIRPRRTFEDIARRPDFALPLIIVMLVDLFVVWIGLVRFGVRGCAQLAFTRGAPELLSFEMDRKFVVLQIIAPYWQALAWNALRFSCVVAGALGVQGIAFRRNLSNVKSVAGVAAYSTLVYLVGGLLSLCVILWGNPERFNPKFPSPTNLS